ncbi:MAG: hypothetical protein QNJ46_16495 [Leptolyngbyaceae cyanobacterium MO_188.B28]|nr:hypothetical protein [Leptolyngbyaceae cyanobacterium MO_188.B28]
MLTFHPILEPEEHWSDLLDKEVIYLGNEADPVEIVAMPEGMASGRTSISIRLDLPDGRVVIVETALYELARVVREIQERFGE